MSTNNINTIKLTCSTDPQQDEQCKIQNNTTNKLGIPKNSIKALKNKNQLSQMIEPSEQEGNYYLTQIAHT
jgi:hypothetical protein